MGLGLGFREWLYVSDLMGVYLDPKQPAFFQIFYKEVGKRSYCFGALL